MSGDPEEPSYRHRTGRTTPGKNCRPPRRQRCHPTRNGASEATWRRFAGVGLQFAITILVCSRARQLARQEVRNEPCSSTSRVFLGAAPPSIACIGSSWRIWSATSRRSGRARAPAADPLVREDADEARRPVRRPAPASSSRSRLRSSRSPTGRPSHRARSGRAPRSHSAVQVLSFAIVKLSAKTNVMAGWGVGAILRFVVLGVYALVVVKALGLHSGAALLSLVAFFFLSTLLEPLLLKS